MIALLQKGKYTLLQVLGGLRLLILEKKAFGWKRDTEEIFLTSQKAYEIKNITFTGKYRLYMVTGEKGIESATHLELFVGDGMWEGYVLPEGLPKTGERKKIVRIAETITKTTH